ncbi:thioredoxin family protein [Miniphocaeibacter massiliensis]|uniref:thioredoxin family protein n=1 Tax=Miniphocaeibacter massiliensis TaxID=2041841 RepID=UPI000C1C7B55|nr:thioredoxin family protein [Miniphocaeibacter massiliensis]
MNIDLTTENFEENVLKSDIPVLVDFWKFDCVPCVALEPIINELAEEANGYKVFKVNIKENLELARKYVIFSAPTTMIFKDGKMVKAISGYQEKQTILDALNGYL